MAFCLSLVATCVYGQAQQAQKTQQTQQTKPFQPEVGQDGKDVVWVPTPQVLVDKMLDMAKVTPQDYVIDLGSGDGRTVITAAKRGARALGIEYNPEMVTLSIANAAKDGVGERAKFMKADLFETDFSQATVVTMFLLPEINLKLRPKILEMKPGTRVVSNSFRMEDWEPDETATVEEGCISWCTALLWIVPAKVGGKWRLSAGELTLTQEFQMLSGTLTSSGRNTPISDARMRGDEITFRAGGSVYTGRVKGNAIEGTAKTNGSSVAWSATREER
ncbi:MAG: class I SAM-dependent methyltransferase [Acidobacteriia bacterium]|nr:class I SAM-dependent methyltransferase [Terriglobia bacterium]